MTTAHRFLNTLLLCLGLSLSALAQKEVLYSQYMFNPLAINPAFAGVREDFSMTLAFRGRLFSFLSQGAQSIATPITQSFSADGQLGTGRFGLGFQVLNDRNSTLGSGFVGFSPALSYRLDLPNLARLYVGVQGSVTIIPVIGIGTNVGGNSALFGAGLGAFYDADKFFAGLSIPELSIRTEQFSGIRFRNPIYLQAGAKLPLADEWLLMPSVVVSQAINGSEPVAFDLNAKLWYHHKAAVGVSARQSNNFTTGTYSYLQATLDYQLSNNIRVGYQFNSTAPEAPFSSFQPTMHELVFRFTPNPNPLKFSYF
jgi:type IX secretion system PorP/SprF family membrane protein